MNINCGKGHKVVYTGCDEDMINFGGNDDPRHVLVEGEKYVVERTEVHSWHTKVYLEDFKNLRFNSVCFEDAEEGE